MYGAKLIVTIAAFAVMTGMLAAQDEESEAQAALEEYFRAVECGGQ